MIQRNIHVLCLIVGALLAGSCGETPTARATSDDDRPPIVVKGGSIHFEASGDDNDGWERVGNDNTKWRHKRETSNNVVGFRIWVVRGDATICEVGASSRDVIARYMPSDGAPDPIEFRLRYSGPNVFLDAPRDMTLEGRTLTFADPHGVVVAVGVQRQGQTPGRACPVPHDANARVQSQKP